MNVFIDTAKQLDKEIAMKQMCMKRKLSFRNEILLGTLVLAILAGLGTAGYSRASGRNSQAPQPGKISIFDPFTYSSTTVPVEQIGKSASVSLGRFINDRDDSERFHHSYSHIVRIPYRPVVRSPFRPPFTPPGPPSGVPGRPDWAPPGSPW